MVLHQAGWTGATSQDLALSVRLKDGIETDEITQDPQFTDDLAIEDK